MRSVKILERVAGKEINRLKAKKRMYKTPNRRITPKKKGTDNTTARPSRNLKTKSEKLEINLIKLSENSKRTNQRKKRFNFRALEYYF